MNATVKMDPVDAGIIWSRFVSVADEMVSAMERTAFSTMVRASGDFSCMIFDARGKLIAQGATSVPSFTGTGPSTLAHILDVFDAAALRDGDIIVTNDPWIGTGHTFDINVVKPVFFEGRIAGYCLTVSHLADVGGVGMGSVAKDVYEEGFSLPPVKLFEAGVENRFVFDFIRNNVRTVDYVLGDIYCNVAACNVGAQGLVKILVEHKLSNTIDAADAIFALTRKSINAKLELMPKGSYAATIPVEGGKDFPDISLSVTVTLSDSGFAYDFDGTDPVVNRGVNVPICYTRAFCYFCTKVLVAPSIPNNQAILDFVTIAAPDNCILNALRPNPTGARHVFGHFVGPLIFNALAEAFPDDVQADSGMVFQMNLRGQTRAGKHYSSIYFSAGGYGALAGYDGRPALPAPANIIGGSVEFWEQQICCTFLKKEILRDSGGPGEFQGGNGQIFAIRNDTGHPIEASFMASRTKIAAKGFAGAGAGAHRLIFVDDVETDPKARVLIPDGGIVEIRDAGGGGYGNPDCRSLDDIAADLEAGLISAQFVDDNYPRQARQLARSVGAS
ncbi:MULTISPECIES: hydantoinase B/oxoprolinase family protein [unclassified Caballeronia]|uniref:hydantoinase B/oxoprolinase family protein n=1 Tax=unclassified Caballeronia TaxID=2646786 RepID=UPI002854D3CE|nr:MULTISPECIES: hydantoinase B/oxoprolinase family protein [unclassified Caballeronia]MDR5773190.1 hydantoinase B/oxoprolinase family protein [Caballeronia sp. LZ002]MDR5848624.1 hydantoinase B/oxoprolinase family protein [Caballeronia sp. LZ003]